MFRFLSRVSFVFFILGALHAQLPEPLDTIIVEPEDQRSPHVFKTGRPIAYSATDGMGRTDFTFNWRLLGQGGQVIEEFQGASGFFSVEQAGAYALICSVRDNMGHEDTTPASRTLLILDDPDFTTNIVAPAATVLEINPGETVEFVARAHSGIDDAPLTDVEFEWKLILNRAEQPPQVFEGSEIAITFEQKGNFTLIAQARDIVTGYLDPTPSLREIIVSPAHVTITSPFVRPEKPIEIALNQPFTFKGRVRDNNHLVTRTAWVLAPEEQIICEDVLECEFAFTEQGIYALALVAFDEQNNVLAKDFRRVLAGNPPLIEIVKPLRRQEIPVGVETEFEVRVSGLSDPEVVWAFGNRRINGPKVTIPGFPKAGHFPVRVFARDRVTDQVIRDEAIIHAFDPEAIARAEIISPRTDVRIRPGDTVFCDSSFRGTISENIQPYWEIVQLEEDRLARSSDSPTLGRYTINAAGTYECRLFVRTPAGNRLLDTRTIVVTNENPSDFEENNAPAGAAPIGAGTYSNLVLDRGHYYRLSVPADNLSVRVRSEVAGEAIVRVFGGDGAAVIERTVNGSGTVIMSGLPAGEYLWGIFPPETNKNQNKGLSFSFSVDVLNPALYFTEIEESQTNTTQFGVVNTNAESVDTEFIAYDADGSILEKVSITLQAMASLKATLADVFESDVDQIAWVRVDATKQIVGFSQVNSIDGKQSFAVNAANALLPELYVPHIAADTETFFTKASVINGLDSDAQPVMMANGTPTNLKNEASYTKDSFDFVTRLGGSLPSDLQWATFSESTQSPNLAGTEVFGKNKEQQIVGLGLGPTPAENPNFTQVRNDLYFTHIARDTNRFWTGLTLVNTSDTTQSAIVRGFGPGGALIGQKQIDMAPFDKMVSLAETFLEGIGSPENIDWVEVQADGALVGYELFGTFDNKQMAGLEAISILKSDICFPFLNTTGSLWHGYSVVNTSDQVGNVNFTLYDDFGNPLQTVSREVQAKEKLLFLATDLFGELPFEAAWVKADADFELAGFQLFGTDETMSGIIAQ